jgi:copper chaperone
MIELNVASMSCGPCVQAVTQAVKSVDPNARVEVDLPTHKVRVDTNESRDKVVAALTEAGYTPG